MNPNTQIIRFLLAATVVLGGLGLLAVVLGVVLAQSSSWCLPVGVAAGAASLWFAFKLARALTGPHEDRRE